MMKAFPESPERTPTERSVLRWNYENAVSTLADKAAAMRKEGKSSEQIARALHADRRALEKHFESLTPVDKLADIHARQLERYGDKLGPSIDGLRAQGKSWEQIIESASRPGGRDLWF